MHKEDVYKNFENVNSWISNADNKASILMAIGIGIVSLNYSIFKCFMNLVNFINGDVNYNLFQIVCLFVNIVLVIVYLIFIFCFSKYIYNALLPNVEKEKDSNLFFGAIAKKKSSNEFKKSLLAMNCDDLKSELTEQIYINSKICSSKFSNVKKATKFLFLIVLTAFVTLIISNLY